MDAAEGRRIKASSIRFEEVTKLYPHSLRPAVERVSLTVEPGELVVLLGPSGCGKTTLLKLANRLLEPNHGRVTIDGQDVRDIPAHLLRRHIGYVIQQTGLFPHMLVEENVAVVPRLLGWNPEEISSRIDQLLELLGLPPEHYRRRYPGQLSGGEQQRVGLARALAARPSTILMDEPFGALDAITRARLQEQLLRIHRRLGQTIVFVTHDVEEAMRLADRIAVMKHGQIVQFDRPESVVLSPADSFVADLIGSRDVLRRLGLIPVLSALKPLGNRATYEGLLSIPDTEDLREALSMLLETDHRELVVLDPHGTAIGTVDLESIHEAISAHASPRRLSSGDES